MSWLSDLFSANPDEARDVPLPWATPMWDKVPQPPASKPAPKPALPGGLHPDLFSVNPDDYKPTTGGVDELGRPIDTGLSHPGYDDYVGDVPTKRKPEEVFDEGLKKFREEHPLKPLQAAQAAPPMPGAGQATPGMLTPEMSGPYGALPSGFPGAAGAAPLATLENTGQAPKPAPAPTAPPVTAPQMLAGPTPGAPAFQSAETPAQAQPTEGGGGPGPHAPSASRGMGPAEGAHDLTDASPGLLSKFMHGLSDNSSLLLNMGAGMLGAPSWATAFSRGFAGAAQGAQADQRYNTQAGSQQAMYQALVQAGVPRLQAIAATTNPALASKLAEEYLTSRKGEIKDITVNGVKRSVMYDPFSKQITELDGSPLRNGGAAGDFATLPPNYDPTTGRDETYLAALKQADPTRWAAVESMLKGGMPPTGRNMQQVMEDAARAEMGFSPTTYKARQQLETSYFGGGEGFKSLRAANTAVDAGVDLQDAIKKLKNYSLAPGFMNPVTGKIAEQYSKPYQRALADFEAKRHTFASELEFALKGKSTVTGTKGFEQLFDAYAAPDKNISALESALSQLDNRIDAHEQAYRAGFAHTSGEPFKDFLTNRGRLNDVLAGKTVEPRHKIGAPPPLPRVGSPEEAAKLPPGTHFYDPNGVERIRP